MHGNADPRGSSSAIIPLSLSLQHGIMKSSPNLMACLTGEESNSEILLFLVLSARVSDNGRNGGKLKVHT